MKVRFCTAALSLCLGLLLSLRHVPASGQTDGEKPKVSETPLNSDQLAVYKAVLDEWAPGNHAAIDLSMLTESLGRTGEGDAGGCFKGHRIEDVAPGVVHRIRNQDLPSLGTLRLRLVDPEEQAGEVKANDPQNAVFEGRGAKDIDKTVNNAFAHGMFTLGEIHFDKTHTYALVFYSFWCGSLCGHGNTLVMKKMDGKWRRIKMCGGWIS
jgi:hypothetical protein